jgi:8-amino-7-oxononanoate synthase
MANYTYVRNATKVLQEKASSTGLMHGTIDSRNGASLFINSKMVTNFANCSYLGLDTDKRLIAKAQKNLADFGINFCAARTRLSIEPLLKLEKGLTDLFGAPAVTFPSVTTTHVNALPLLASGIFFSDRQKDSKQIVIFDRFAHASMQSLIPTIREYAEVRFIAHNSLTLLREELRNAKEKQKNLIYVCDSVYSMGGTAPILDLLDMLNDKQFFLYVDDAHGTSIFGENGEGLVLSQMKCKFPSNLFLTFSLTKGFGCNGGGVVTKDLETIQKIKSLGPTYQFSGGMDFASIGASLEALSIHTSGEIKNLQKSLWENVSFFDSLMFTNHSCATSPIRMIHIGDAKECIDFGEYLMEHGFYVPTVFFPVVPQDAAQLRICLTSSHTKTQISLLCETIKMRLKSGFKYSNSSVNI